MSIPLRAFRRYFTLLLFLVFVSAQVPSLAQVGAPYPGHAQVIAQGIQDIPGGDMQWHLRLATATAAGSNQPTVVSGGFVITEDGQILASDTLGDRQLLSPGQGAFASSQNPITLTSVSGQPLDFLEISLEASPVDADGVVTTPFVMERGAYNLQMTRGLLNPGETDLFYPVNDLQYAVYVPWGEVRYSEPGHTNDDLLLAGDSLQAWGDLEIRNDSDDISAYFVWSIGDKVETTGQSQSSASLQVEFLECASGWVEADGLDECFASADHPNLTIMNMVGEQLTLTTDVDAVSTETGIYLFPDLPPGTYLLMLEYDSIWDIAKTHWYSDAYTDSLDWYVDVSEVNTRPVVTIVLGWVGDGSLSVPNDDVDIDEPIWAPGSMGYAMIVQEECNPGQFEANCTPADLPWEVYLTHQSTSEMFMLSVEGTPMGNGVWMMIVPAGVYWVDVQDAGWYVEYSSQIEVFAGSETYLYLTGYAP